MVNCPNCGRPLEDGQICDCQSTQGSQQANIPQGNNKFPVPVLVGGAVAVVAIIIILVVALMGSGNSYMGMLNGYIKAVNSKTTDSVTLMSNLMPKYTQNYTKDVHKFLLETSDFYSETMDSSSELLEDTYDNILDEYDSFKLSFEVKSEKEIKEKDLEDYADAIEDRMEDSLDALEDSIDEDDAIESIAESMDMDEDDCIKYIEKEIAFIEKNFDKVEVTEGMKVKGKFIIKADDDEFETDTVSLLFIKVNGQWCYYGLDGDYLSSFEDDDDYLFSSFINIFNNKYYYSGLSF